METSDVHRVLIAHHHPPLAALIRERLGAEPGLEICGVAYTGAALRILVGSFQPDILILDAHFETHGLGVLCRHFHLIQPNLRILVLTTGTAVEDLRPVLAQIATLPATAIAT
eukprot:gene9242-12489_t